MKPLILVGLAILLLLFFTPQHIVEKYKVNKSNLIFVAIACFGLAVLILLLKNFWLILLGIGIYAGYRYLNKK